MNWEQLIKERDEWVAHNFPNNTIPNPQESILGVIEEVGELAHAHLKGLQSIRGTQEEHDANARDAVGDATVYLWGVLSHWNVVPQIERLPNHFLEELTDPQGCIFQAAKWAGSLKITHVRLASGTAAYRCGRVVAALAAYCAHRDWDYEEVVMETWNRVKQRDWIANPQDGNENLLADL